MLFWVRRHLGISTNIIKEKTQNSFGQLFLSFFTFNFISICSVSKPIIKLRLAFFSAARQFLLRDTFNFSYLAKQDHLPHPRTTDYNSARFRFARFKASK